MNLDRLVSGRTRLLRRVLIVAVTLAAAAAAVWMAIEYSLFLYLVYVAVSLLVGAVATSTLIWMLYAWRTPDSLAGSRLEADGRRPKHSFSLIVPARHEEAVLETTLSRLISSDYTDYEVLVVVGSDDPGTREVAERMADRHPGRIQVIVDASWPKSKPKALNAALPHCYGSITGVFDAEDDVHPALLRRVDQCFQTTDADIVQAGVQLMNFRSRWFTVHNVLEYYFWFRSRLHVHARQRFIPLGGNTVFIRTPIVRAVGGWADCLAEDCEIGVRLSALGARTAVFYEPELVTREECPPTVGHFIRQRTRWNQGFLQTLGRGYWRRLPARQSLLGAYILASPYFMALAWLMIPAAIATAVAVKAPIVITLISFLPLLPMFSMLVVECAGLAEFCRLYSTGRPSVRDYARLILGLLIYQALLAFAAARAVVREARGSRGWEKTAHLGLHLGRQATADTGSAMAVGNLPQPGEVEQAAPISPVLEANPQRPSLAESLIGSHGMVEVQADPLISRAMARPAEELGLRAYAMSGQAANGHQAGNGHAALDSRTLDGMFGDLSGAPLWARLSWVRPRGPDDTLLLPRSGSGDDAAAARRPGQVRRFLRGIITGRVELALLLILLVVAAVVTATNLLHWPASQFDEGTYISYAWALQHGRLANYTYSYGHPPLAWLLIFFWNEAGGALGHVVFSIDRGRAFMLLVSLVSCALLYFLARRLDFSRVSAGAALILFALSPLGVFFHRAVLLDNPSMAFAIAAFLLAWTPNRRLWAFAGSGACFAFSVLCKETTFALLPALVVAVVQNTDRRTRRYCLMLFLAFFVLAGGFYPLYATLKGELLPGHGHVSLTGYLIVQLFTRQGTGSVFSHHSQAHAIVAQWLQLDPWLLGAALALSPVALARRTTRAVALAFLIQVVTVFRPGYLPNMYVIGMLPFAALTVPGSIEALWRRARSLSIPGVSWGLRVAAAAVACALVLAAAPHWASGDRTAMTVRLDGPDRAAQQWVLQHVPRNKRIIVDDEYWLFLIQHGYNDRPMRGGFFSDTVVSYWPLDYDPAVKRTFPQGWREFDYLVLTQAILVTVTNTPTAAAAIRHSRVLASFGQGTGTIQIRKIVGTGR
jgi:cellulose synthase/poly-beta-1,6-N-acetylglucosamine synthase-like glycosyltransferase/4-amino-4-deoxy-L-arabinose transferase-like glycosyltransferase